mmetsp:Transcript_20668/g.61681  ORF Transcript_20668/g.61681 Transcript_20668/m.61681 type:complete len:83 (-) Transcript_20668:1458-1706(-)
MACCVSASFCAFTAPTLTSGHGASCGTHGLSSHRFCASAITAFSGSVHGFAQMLRICQPATPRAAGAVLPDGAVSHEDRQVC